MSSSVSLAKILQEKESAICYDDNDNSTLAHPRMVTSGIDVSCVLIEVNNTPDKLSTGLNLVSRLALITHMNQGRKEGNVLFNDALNTFYLRLYGFRDMVKEHSDSEKGNPLPPHRLLLSINSKGSFICTIPQTG